MSEHAAPTTTWIGDSTIGTRFPAWTRGNAADVFPEPFSVIGRDLVLLQGMSRGLRDAYIAFGALDWEEFEHPEMPDLFMRFGAYILVRDLLEQEAARLAVPLPAGRAERKPASR